MYTWDKIRQQRSGKKLLLTGGKLTENIVQAIARDCLAEAINNLVTSGYRILFHIHDEVIAEIPKTVINETDLQNMISLMCRGAEWAEGLPLNADGFISEYYKKE